ncbi:electron-transferring-flavoproteindehydrogenase [Talaromyces islandicus]|uniref:Probable electron transfer flavoprotein-ubiquinone oxidoreductase, mitochondrial n=1 Tax=Talaromyces islandicus TaxID=28573 RepID=A0A0U1MC20_TALIS|nr:electron-transferring-flavoproteindehydrogenase [Talaromyces islandicus]
MASKRAVLPLLRSELPASRRAWRSGSSISSSVSSSWGRYPSSRRPAKYQCCASNTLHSRPYHKQSRQFSHSVSRQNADAEEKFDPSQIERESDEVDVCIVGGGPAGLAAAIRLKQLANEAGNEEFRVILLEKAGELGAHIVSGNVLQPTALNELLPDWLDENNPSRFENVTPAKSDQMRFLTKNSSFPIPMPPQMHNHGNYIVSLSQLTKWLGDRAEELGVEVYPGFAASEVLYKPDGSVRGVATNDLGIGRDGAPKDTFERGMEFHAKVTLLGEGCHGSLTKQVIKKYDLRRDSQPQTYGLGIKEVWEVQPEKFRPGEIVHAMGYPLPSDTYGGAWIYHFGENLVSVGLVVGLDYPNPWLSPYGEFQKLKHHPLYKEVLEGGKCISYGARALNEGGFQSIPKVAFPGGALIGDTAGFLNVPKIKGTHTAIKSGMLAAEATFSALQTESDGSVFLYNYEDSLRKSWIWKELQEVRNMRPSFGTSLGLWGGILYSGLEAFILRGKAPWTLKHHKTDAAATKLASQCEKIEYPKPDGVLSFDILTSVSRTGTNHEEDQPVHLQVKDWDEHTKEAWPKYQGVENRFCPAGVYEYLEDPSKEQGVRFQINAQNCIHCKTCDIKVPTQDINWQTPQGGEGPNFILPDLITSMGNDVKAQQVVRTLVQVALELLSDDNEGNNLEAFRKLLFIIHYPFCPTSGVALAVLRQVVALSNASPYPAFKDRESMSFFERNKPHAFAGLQCEQCNNLQPLVERIVLGIQQIDVALHRLELGLLPGQDTTEIAPPRDLREYGPQGQLEWGLVALERGLHSFGRLLTFPRQQLMELRLESQHSASSQSAVPRTAELRQGQNFEDSSKVHRILPPLPSLNSPFAPREQQHSDLPIFQSRDLSQSNMSNSNAQIQYLRHEITSKTLALQDLQRDYDKLLTNVIPTHHSYLSGLPPLLADKISLERQVSELQAQVRELLRAQEDAQKESTASRNQYMQIMAMSSRLQAQSTTDARRWQAEKEEWDKQRLNLVDKIQRLERGERNEEVKHDSNDNDNNNNNSSLDMQALEQKCRSLERHIRGLNEETVQLDEALQTTLRLSASIRAKFEQAG